MTSLYGPWLGVPSGPSWVSVWSKGGPELIRQKGDTSKTVGIAMGRKVIHAPPCIFP